jgi:hypothetical protein
MISNPKSEIPDRHGGGVRFPIQNPKSTGLFNVQGIKVKDSIYENYKPFQISI